MLPTSRCKFWSYFTLFLPIKGKWVHFTIDWKWVILYIVLQWSWRDMHSMEIVQDSRIVLSWLVLGSMSAFCSKFISMLILRVFWAGVSNTLLVSEICAILDAPILKIQILHGLWVEFSAWGYKLKWMCRILCLSVTGKVWNLQKRKIYMWFEYLGQFWGASLTHLGLNKCVVKGYWSESALLNFLFECFNKVWVVQIPSLS